MEFVIVADMLGAVNRICRTKPRAHELLWCLKNNLDLKFERGVVTKELLHKAILEGNHP